MTSEGLQRPAQGACPATPLPTQSHTDGSPSCRWACASLSRGLCSVASAFARAALPASLLVTVLLLQDSSRMQVALGNVFADGPCQNHPSVDAKVESGRLFPPCSIFLTALSPQRSCCFFLEAVSGPPSYPGLTVLSSELRLSDVGPSPLPRGVCGPIRPQTTEAQARPRFLCVDRALLHCRTLMSAGWVEMRRLSLGLPQ